MICYKLKVENIYNYNQNQNNLTINNFFIKATFLKIKL